MGGIEEGTGVWYMQNLEKRMETFLFAETGVWQMGQWGQIGRNGLGGFAYPRDARVCNRSRARAP